MPDLGSMAMDERLALRTAARNLAHEFVGVFGSETIERFLVSSYDEIAPRTRVRNFVVLMAERFARERLRALARVEGRVDLGVPVVLFLCVHNAGRSQLARAGSNTWEPAGFTAGRAGPTRRAR
jgi:arsenate reductase